MDEIELLKYWRRNEGEKGIPNVEAGVEVDIEVGGRRRLGRQLGGHAAVDVIDVARVVLLCHDEQNVRVGQAALLEFYDVDARSAIGLSM